MSIFGSTLLCHIVDCGCESRDACRAGERASPSMDLLVDQVAGYMPFYVRAPDSEIFQPSAASARSICNSVLQLLCAAT